MRHARRPSTFHLFTDVTMQIGLANKTALVTGSTAGIGLATARQLAAAGAEVIINGRNEDSDAEALEQLRHAVAGATFTGVAADVATDDGYRALLAAAPTVDILVNNAGLFAIQDVLDISDDDWRQLFEVNVLAGARLARAYAPAMVENDWGRIVFISSESAFNVPVDAVHYGATKAAVVASSRGFAKRLAGTGVTVNAVLPGPTLTGAMQRILADGMQASSQ